jgi:hypothetical protein
MDDTPTFTSSPSPDTPSGERHAPREVAKDSALAALRAEAVREVRLPSLNLSVPARPDFGMRFDVNIPSDQLVRWSSRSERGPKGKEEVDSRKFASLVLLSTLTAILHRPDSAGADEVSGELWEAITSDGPEAVALTFHDDEIQDLLGASSPDAALRAWYGSDGHLMQAATSILNAAGYAEDDVNPLMAQ